jgi:hypothetical protein
MATLLFLAWSIFLHACMYARSFFFLAISGQLSKWLCNTLTNVDAYPCGCSLRSPACYVLLPTSKMPPDKMSTTWIIIQSKQPLNCYKQWQLQTLSSNSHLIKSQFILKRSREVKIGVPVQPIADICLLLCSQHKIKCHICLYHPS